MQLNRFAKVAWAVLAYNVAVVLWGAYVRATGSGAGCGSHWPLCNGEIIPLSPPVATIIEFVHRLTSGLSLLLVIGLLLWAFRAYARGHPVRLGASLAMLFVITEALVGAGLVLFQWVAKDVSTGRVISMAVHLINTFLLLGSLTLTAWWASGGEKLHLRGHGLGLWLFTLAFLGVIGLGVSGATTALGDTLFPSATLAQGIQQDFSPMANLLIRLRVWHPVTAIGVGVYLMILGGFLVMFRVNRTIQRFILVEVILVILQLCAGIVNVLLLAPVWMQIVHLFLADSVWICLVLLAATNFAESEVCQSIVVPKTTARMAA